MDHDVMRKAEDALPLTVPMYRILQSLYGVERHGYGIRRDVEERTNGEMKLGFATLYGALKRLLDEGLVEEVDERPDPAVDDQRRRYYRMTPFGREVLFAEQRRYMEMAREVDSVRGQRPVPVVGGA